MFSHVIDSVRLLISTRQIIGRYPTLEQRSALLSLNSLFQTLLILLAVKDGQAMVTIRYERLGCAWFAVAENEKGHILSSSFSLVGKTEAVEAILKNLPATLRDGVKEKRGKSSTLQMMYKLYCGKAVKGRPSLDMQSISPFTKSVYEVTSMIPRGFVSTYGMIASNLSNRFAQRAVGNAMRFNPFPLFIPCHRVVPSTMNVGRYSLSSNLKSDSNVKRAILLREGVEFNGKKVLGKSLWSSKRRG